MNPRLAFLSLVISILSAPMGAHASWTLDGVPISTAPSFQMTPMIVSDGFAGAIVTWMDGRNGGGGYDVYTQRVNFSGVAQWTTNGVALGIGVGDQKYPAIVADGFGGAIVTWQDTRNGSPDVYVQRINASGAVQWTANGVALCTAAGSQLNPAIASDGAGGAIITWRDARSGNSDIYAQRIDASGTVQWTANGVAVCAATGEQVATGMVSDGSGGAVVTWEDTRADPNYDVYAQRINGSGVAQWTTDGVALCTAAGAQLGGTISSDGSGGAIVSWDDNRTVDGGDIYARRINAAGVAQWTADGVALCTATNTQQTPTISSDGSRGAIVTWYDYRSGEADIYAQRVDATGVTQWTADGVALCMATSLQQTPTVSSDGSGGAIVAWTDLRSGVPDIYAQRVNSAGTIQWTTDGVAVCTAAGQQLSNVIVSDGSAGAIVAWYDLRGVADVYAQRVGPNGLVPTSVGETPSFTDVSLSANSPNPFTNETAMDLNLAVGANVNVTVYDVAGREVRRIGYSYMGAGLHQMNFDGHDDKGRSLVSGVYFYKATVNGKTITRKMVIAR